MKRPLVDEPGLAPLDAAPKIPRNRPVRSCMPCHRNKRKCDRGRPCARCVKLGNIGGCLYEVPEMDAGASTDNEIDTLRKRVVELEAIVRSLRSRPRPASPPPLHSSRTRAGKEALMQKESDAIDVLQSSAAARRGAYTDDSDSDEDEDLMTELARVTQVGEEIAFQPSQLPPEPFQPKIHTIGTRQMLVGAAAAPLLPIRLNELATLPPAVAFDGFLLTENGASDPCAWRGPNDADLARRLILGSMPEADEAANLLQDFQTIVELQHRGWFSPFLETRYSAFFLSSPAGRSQYKGGSLAIICAVLALSYHICQRASATERLQKINEAVGGEEHIDKVSSFFASATLVLLKQCETNPTLESIQAQLILSIYLNNADQLPHTAQLLPTMVRQAQLIGLHVDPRKIFRAMPFVEQEVRRRLWWAIQELDTLISLLTGLPPSITSSDCDLPQDRTEQSLTGPCAETPEPLPAIGVTLQSFHVYRLECTLYAREILSRVFKLTSWHWNRSAPETAVPGVEEVSRIDAAIKLWHSRIPSALCYELDAVRNTPIGSARRGTDYRNLAHRGPELATQTLLLTIYANTILVLLHRPFLQHAMWSIQVGTTAERQVLYSAMTVVTARARLGSLALAFWADAFAYTSALTLVQLAIRLVDAGVSKNTELQTACKGVRSAAKTFFTLGGAKNMERGRSLISLEEALQARHSSQLFSGSAPTVNHEPVQHPPTPVSPFGPVVHGVVQPYPVGYSSVRND